MPHLNSMPSPPACRLRAGDDPLKQQLRGLCERPEVAQSRAAAANRVWLGHQEGDRPVTENIAHDLRTPLTHLFAGLERVRRRETMPDGYTDAIDETIVETKGLLITFNALLRIAEIEADARRTGFQTFDLMTLTTDVADFYEPMVEQKRVSLAVEHDATGSVQLAGDPNLVFEAIGNLLGNAIKLTPGGRTALPATRDGFGIQVRGYRPGHSRKRAGGGPCAASTASTNPEMRQELA